MFFNFPFNWSNCGGSGLTLGNDGNFYGACESGNPATGMGSIFRLTPAGVFTDVYDFTGANGDSLPVYPPIQASSSIGTWLANPKTPNTATEPVSLYTSHCCAVVCIHVPISEISCPMMNS